MSLSLSVVFVCSLVFGGISSVSIVVLFLSFSPLLFVSHLFILTAIGVVASSATFVCLCDCGLCCCGGVCICVSCFSTSVFASSAFVLLCGVSVVSSGAGVGVGVSVWLSLLSLLCSFSDVSSSVSPECLHAIFIFPWFSFLVSF